MISYALAHTKPLGDPVDPGTKWWLSRTSEGGVDTYEWNGPFLQNCTTFTGNRAIAAMLQGMGARYNTSSATAEVIALKSHF